MPLNDLARMGIELVLGGLNGRGIDSSRHRNGKMIPIRINFRQPISEEERKEQTTCRVEGLFGPGAQTFPLQLGFERSDIPCESSRSFRFQRSGQKCFGRREQVWPSCPPFGACKKCYVRSHPETNRSWMDRAGKSRNDPGGKGRCLR